MSVPPRAGSPFVVALFIAAIAGCTSIHNTEPSRTATEQLLISTAADRAIEQLQFPTSAGDRMFLVDSRFESYDKGYVLSAITHRLLAQGGRLVAEAADADVTVEIRSGALSTIHEKFLLGIPELQIPVPPLGSFTLPELALFKRDHQEGIAKFAMHVTRRKDGLLVAGSGPVYGNSELTNWAILTISFTTQDLTPED